MLKFDIANVKGEIQDIKILLQKIIKNDYPKFH